MDVVNAISAIRSAKLPHVNANRVGMLGHSMGGGVALNILTAYPDLVQAGVLYAPVNSDAWENFVRWRSERDADDQTVTVLGTRELNAKAWDALSSRTLLSKIASPLLLFQGTKDKDVPLEWSKDLATRLVKLKKDIAYIEYEGEAHEFGPQWTNFMATTAAFFRRELSAKSEALLSETRVTKKPFGLEVSPEHSPVSPERFRGFHAGTDFELSASENPLAFEVPAICDGVILSAGRVSGYGGAVTERCSIDGSEASVVYGHLAVSALRVKTGQNVIAGQALGRLGKGNTAETDYERSHVHIGIHRGPKSDVRGYVQTRDALKEWIDPLSLVGR
jgi:dienelactone hydrolase